MSKGIIQTPNIDKVLELDQRTSQIEYFDRYPLYIKSHVTYSILCLINDFSSYNKNSFYIILFINILLCIIIWLVGNRCKKNRNIELIFKSIKIAIISLFLVFFYEYSGARYNKYKTFE